MEDNQPSFINSIKTIFVSFSHFFGEIKTLAALEFELAKKSLILLILLIPIIVLLVISTWLLICGGLVALIVVLFHISIMYALFIVAAFNILIIILLGLYMLSLKHNLTFPATRKQLQLGDKHGKRRAIKKKHS